MSLIVQKYGGTSVATPEHIKRVAEQVVKEKEKGNRIIVVVSAIGDTTDHLVQLAAQVSKNPPEREMDMLLSVGERTSIALLAMAIHELGHDAISFTGSQVGIITDTRHTEARILEVRANRLLEELEKGRIVIVAGFQGVSVNKEITTLGRGGSDTTAIALAAALKADRCEIMKDVDGVYIAEPKVVPGVRLNDQIGYDEMIEMAGMGAGVLQMESIELAKVHKIKIAVGSSFTGKIGTIVTDRSLQSSSVSGIVGKKGMAHVRTTSDDPEFNRYITRELAERRVKTQAFIGERNGPEFLVQESKVKQVVQMLSDARQAGFGFSTEINQKKGVVAIIGTGLNFSSEISRKIFTALNELQITTDFLQISQLRISWMMPEDEVDSTIQQLYGQLAVTRQENVVKGV